VSRTYHSTSTDEYQLRIAVLVVKIIIQLIKDNIRRVIPCDLSPSINNTLHAHLQYITYKIE
jgi:hypothetical protein